MAMSTQAYATWRHGSINRDMLADVYVWLTSGWGSRYHIRSREGHINIQRHGECETYEATDLLPLLSLNHSVHLLFSFYLKNYLQHLPERDQNYKKKQLQKTFRDRPWSFTQRDVKVIEAHHVTCSEALSHVQFVLTAISGICSSGP